MFGRWKYKSLFGFFFFYLIGQPPEKEMEKLWKIGKGHLEEDPENVVIRARVRFSIQTLGKFIPG